MFTPLITSEINTLRVQIETHLTYLTRTITEKTDQLTQFKQHGDVKRATTISNEIEKQKLHKSCIEEIDTLLKAYLENGDPEDVYIHKAEKDLLEGFRAHQQKYPTNWSISKSLWALFQTDNTDDIRSKFTAFVNKVAKPLIDAEHAQQIRAQKEMEEYFKTPQGKEMAATIRFIARG